MPSRIKEASAMQMKTILLAIGGMLVGASFAANIGNAKFGPAPNLVVPRQHTVRHVVVPVPIPVYRKVYRESRQQYIVHRPARHRWSYGPRNIGVSQGPVAHPVRVGRGVNVGRPVAVAHPVRIGYSR